MKYPHHLLLSDLLELHGKLRLSYFCLIFLSSMVLGQFLSSDHLLYLTDGESLSNVC